MRQLECLWQRVCDMNGHTGGEGEGLAEIMNVYGCSETVLHVCKNQELMVLNTYFRKDKEN